MQLHSHPVSYRVARIVSIVTDPLYLSIPTFFAVASTTAPNLGTGILWFVTTTFFCFTLPWLYVIWSVHRGKYSDRHISVREERTVPMLIALASVFVTFGLLVFLHASRALLASLAAVIVSGLSAILITTRWKVSLHMMGIAGTVTIVTRVFGVPFFLLFPLILLVGWARYYTQAHTFLQILVGSIFAIVVTWSIFGLFSRFISK